MRRRCVELTDLPDEILLLILKKLTNIEVLYSFRDINKRFDILTNDRIFTEHLTLIRNSSNEMNNILNHSMFHRVSTQILPKTHTKIRWLELEPISIEHFLFAGEYPNLHCLTLSNIERQIDLCAFDGKKSY